MVAKTDKKTQIKKPTKPARKIKTSGLRKKVSSTGLMTNLKTHKLIVFLLLVLALFPASYGYEKYKDWDNAQLIRGLSVDFPALITDIEAATGLDLEEKTDCMTTSEKFSSGVRTCELFFGLQASQTDVDKAFEVIESAKKFEIISDTTTNEASRYNYRNKQSCTFSTMSPIYGSCIFSIREANIQLAKDTLSSR
jgi:hypothetical protein